MIAKEIIERIEGEARLEYGQENGIITSASIIFPHFRGMERLMEGRPALDALMVTPRICGICGHAHLIAATRAIEAVYQASRSPIFLTQKARSLREVTLYLELLQNHIKWIYLTIIPALKNLGAAFPPEITAIPYETITETNRILALFAGQAPHSAYALPGGVSCDPTELERSQALTILEHITSDLERNLFAGSLEEHLSVSSLEDIGQTSGDLSLITDAMLQKGLENVGCSHDRLLVAGEHTLFSVSRIIQGTPSSIDMENISEDETPKALTGGRSFNKNVTYAGEFYETGPLARMMARLDPLIKNIHKEHKDSLLTRIIARSHEIAILLPEIKRLIIELDLAQDSFRVPASLAHLSGTGMGIVEAPRGPLIHKTTLSNGMVTNYEIITPTQWNLGNAESDRLATAQKALVGSSVGHSDLIFRSFDVCSVCTTH